MAIQEARVRIKVWSEGAGMSMLDGDGGWVWISMGWDRMLGKGGRLTKLDSKK